MQRVLANQRQFVVDFTVYGGAALLTLAFVFWALQLWRADWNIPFEYNADGLFISMTVKTVQETGWYLHNPALGAPFGQLMYDFPSADINLLFIKGLFLLTRSYAVAGNVFFILTFPITALTALYVFRRADFAYPPAIVGSILFALLPMHILRGEQHLFIATYYEVPLAVLLMFWIDDEMPQQLHLFDSNKGEIRCWNRRLLLSMAFSLLIGLTCNYYAIMTALLLCIAAFIKFTRERDLKPLSIAGLFIVVIGLGLVINVLPTLQYRHTHGRNFEVGNRATGDAEFYGLKIAQLVLPVSGHHFHPLARAKDRYNQHAPLVNENDIASLGAIGSVGFLFLIAMLFSPGYKKTWPAKVQTLARLNLAAVLIGTIGGFGSLFALLVFREIRCYNRISVFIGFFALFTIVGLLDHLYHTVVVPRRAQAIFGILLLLLLIGGVWDQTPTAPSNRFLAYDEKAREFNQDATFVQQIEQRLPTGAMVFQLPYMRFPEANHVERIFDYDLLRPYLHSHSLRWSYGAIAGREGDKWLKQVSSLATPALVQQLQTIGFQGIYIDRNGYADSGKDIEAQLASLLAEQPLISENGRFVFFALPPIAHQHPGKAANGAQ